MKLIYPRISHPVNLQALLASHLQGKAIALAAYQPAATVPLPFFASTIPAGFPSPADDYLDESLDLNDLVIKHPAATFFVRVDGESMIGAGIHPGDVLVVDRTEEPADSKIVVAVLNGEFTVKRMQKLDGKFALVSENPALPPLEITPEVDVAIWGVVTYVVHRVR